MSSSTEFEWVCEDCGQIVNPFEGALGEKTYFYRRQFCPCPAGQAKKVAHEQTQKTQSHYELGDRLATMGGLNGGKYNDYRFCHWDRGRRQPSSSNVYDHVYRYTEDVTRRPPNWLFLFGPYGLGKTHLAIAALRKIAMERLWSAHVIVWTELCQATKESWSSHHGPTEHQLWSRAREAQILLIDDLDKTSITPWAMGHLFNLINYRSVKNKPTIITAQNSHTQLKADWEASKKTHVNEIGLAVLSRIAENLWGAVRFEGHDNRWGR